MRLRDQQMFNMQLARVTSECAGGEVWSLCEKQTCLQGNGRETTALSKQHTHKGA